MVSRLRDSTDPTKGGELSKGELKQMLLFCGGDLDVFRSLGKKPELRFKFIQENAQFAAQDVDV